MDDTKELRKTDKDIAQDLSDQLYNALKEIYIKEKRISQLESAVRTTHKLTTVFSCTEQSTMLNKLTAINQECEKVIPELKGE